MLIDYGRQMWHPQPRVGQKNLVTLSGCKLSVADL